MNHSKSLLIAIAAFAVTATGAQAYVGSKVLSRAGFSTEQISALEEARSLRADGELKKARDVLEQAGIDAEAVKQLREAAKAARAAMQAAVEEADYEAFKVAIADTPLADIITTEADFDLFREAHALHRDGDNDAAKEIFDDLGVPEMGAGGGHGRGRGHWGAHPGLSDDQRDALRAARMANDRETVRAILDEAGERDGWGMKDVH